MNLPFFIAKRLYSGEKRNKRQASRPAVRIATLGVIIGISVMTLSVCVVLGFKREISSKVIGFGGHIEVMNQHSLSSMESIPIEADTSLRKEIIGTEGVEHLQRSSQKMGMLKTENDFQGIMLKGVAEDYDWTFMRSHLIEGSIPECSIDNQDNSILISKEISKALNLKVGERVFAYFFEESIKMRRFKVCGIYQTNMKQFDGSIVMTNLYSVNAINKWNDNMCSSLELTVKDYTKSLKQTNQNIIRLLKGKAMTNGDKYAAMSIRELYPQIFSWLDLLDLNVWVILSLMIALSGFTLISGLLILILEKTSTIGILKALGTPDRQIRSIFLHFATFIIMKGLIIGNILGISLALLQDNYHILKLDASNYYIEYVPIYFNIPMLLGLNLATFIVAILSLIAPSFLISRIEIAKALKFD